MDGVSAATSLIEIIEATLKIGSILFDKYSAYKHAQVEVFELFVRYQGAWFQIQDEIRILQCIVKELQSNLIIHFNHQLIILEEKLRTSLSRLDHVIKNGGTVKSVEYALSQKGPLKKTVDELEAWTTRFKPSWYSTARTLKDSLSKYISAGQIQQSKAASRLEALRKLLHSSQQEALNANIPSLQLETINEKRLAGTSITTARDPNDSSGLVIDKLEASGPTSPYTLDIQAVHKIANRLSVVDDPSHWGLLRCRGLVEDRDDSNPATPRCLFVFEVEPKLSDPRSLRDLLSSTDAPSLNLRIELARSLARSVMFVHNLDLVHKNVRPETVLTFRKGDSPDRHRVSCLAGFESFRYADGPTFQSQKQQWERDLYRHPSRQGIKPLVRYVMQHDIYSLGVCLLEIGLWTSLIKHVGHSTSVQYVPGPLLTTEHLPKQLGGNARPFELKEDLTRLARDKLPTTMGLKYALIAETCLSSWEDDNMKTLFGVKNDFVNQPGILEGVRYSERILMALEEIVI